MSRQLRVTPEIVKELFGVICDIAQTNGAILSQADINLAIFKVNEEKDLFNQAALAMYHIAKNHPFSDGNKRMAYLIAELILNNMGYKVRANPEVTKKLLLKIASGRANLKEVKRWMRKHATEL